MYFTEIFMAHFHLVVDDIVAVANRCFRVQVWRRADSKPLVLLSQVPGHPPPAWFSNRLANVVLRFFRMNFYARCGEVHCLVIVGQAASCGQAVW
jgi:hypothetical protein